MFLGDNAVAVEHQTYQTLADQRADKQVSFPRGEHVPGVEHRARRRDVGIPEIDRLIDAFLSLEPLADWHARILSAVADVGPAIEMPGPHDQNAVATER